MMLNCSSVIALSWLSNFLAMFMVVGKFNIKDECRPLCEVFPILQIGVNLV